MDFHMPIPPDTANCTDTLNNGTLSQRVTGSSALWGVLTLAINAMQQPSIFESAGPPSLISWSRASPLVCLGDVLIAAFIIPITRSTSVDRSWRTAVQEYMTEYRLTRAGSQDASITSIGGILFFTLGVVPQALKIFCMKGEGLIFTQIMCGFYFVAALVSNLFIMLNTSNPSYSEVSAEQDEGNIYTMLDDSGSVAAGGMFILPSLMGFIMVPGYLCGLKKDQNASGRFFKADERFSYGTTSFLGLSLLAVILWLAAVVVLKFSTTDQRLYRCIAKVEFISMIIVSAVTWALMSLFLSTLGLITGIIMAISDKDAWAILKAPMVLIHLVSWVGVGIAFVFLFSFCFAVFAEVVQARLDKFHNRTRRLDGGVGEGDYSDQAYALRTVTRCMWPIFGILHFFFFALIYLTYWEGCGTRKPAWTEFLG